MTSFKRPQKKYAQHWLRCDRTLAEIIAAAELAPGDRVLEIGPGTGVLTEQLLAANAWVTAVEVDSALHTPLSEKFSQNPRFLLVPGDILHLNLTRTLANQSPFSDPSKVVANIPYNITGPILQRLLGKIEQAAAASFDLLVLLVQKEVGERLIAHPGQKAYGALSIRVQYLAVSDMITVVPATAFFPPPRVDSMVVRLRPRPAPIPAVDPSLLAQLITLGFSSRRKMLRNNLKSQIAPDRLTEILKKLDINPQIRAENLGVDQWIALANILVASQP
ncbi:MAG: 16S rRNA (adenine(1518)-N(6)/adenine(1519)-N(6))-dimethyltransferase RsmA [Cyanobacteria bacterium P01_H01_bin.15]